MAFEAPHNLALVSFTVSLHTPLLLGSFQPHFVFHKCMSCTPSESKLSLGCSSPKHWQVWRYHFLYFSSYVVIFFFCVVDWTQVPKHKHKNREHNRQWTCTLCTVLRVHSSLVQHHNTRLNLLLGALGEKCTSQVPSDNRFQQPYGSSLYVKRPRTAWKTMFTGYTSERRLVTKTIKAKKSKFQKNK